jgi:hypothetical protein
VGVGETERRLLRGSEAPPTLPSDKAGMNMKQMLRCSQIPKWLLRKSRTDLPNLFPLMKRSPNFFIKIVLFAVSSENHNSASLVLGLYSCTSTYDIRI